MRFPARNPWPLALAWTVVVGATLAPLLRAQVPPGADMINHLARVHVFKHAGEDPDLSRYYEPAWQLLPNLAFDALMVPLLAVLDTYTAGTAFLALSLAGLFAGVAALRRVIHGRAGWAPLLVALIAYSPLVAIGLANFLFGCGALLAALALFMGSRRWSWSARAVTWSAASTLLFLTHAMIAAVYGLIVMTIYARELISSSRPPSRNDLPIAGQFLVPACLWLMVKSPTHGTLTLFGPLRARLEAVISPVFYFRDWELLLAVCLAVLIVWLLASKRVTIAPALRAPLLVIAGVALVMPMQLLGVWLTHVRLPVIAALLLIAAVRLEDRDRRMRGAIIAALLVMAVLRLVKVDAAMSVCDARRAEVIAAAAALPRGTRLLPVMAPDAVTGDCLFSNYWHMPALAVIERAAFYPQMFVHMQPLRLSPGYQDLSQAQQRPAFPRELSPETTGDAPWPRLIGAEWRRRFDVLFWLHPGTRPGPVPEGLRVAARGSFFTVFAITDPAAAVVPAPAR